MESCVLSSGMVLPDGHQAYSTQGLGDTQSPVLTYGIRLRTVRMVLPHICTCYAMAGTAIAYAATRVL
eukprot:3940588-Rhodomonas_salina.2